MAPNYGMSRHIIVAETIPGSFISRKYDQNTAVARSGSIRYIAKYVMQSVEHV